MTEFLNDILLERNNILTDLGQADEDLLMYLQKVRSTPLEELDNEDKRRLVFLLIKQLQPYLSAANLSTSHLKQNGFEQQFNGQNSIMDNFKE